MLRRNLLDSGYEELPTTGRYAVGEEGSRTFTEIPSTVCRSRKRFLDGITLVTHDAVVAGQPGPICKV